MKKPKPTKRLGMVMFTMLLLCLGACKRNELQPHTPNILNSYRGNDKIVLQVVEELKKPDNRPLLTDIEKQGSINWAYQALITSRFLDGITLRFATGSSGNYLDAEVNAQTMAIRLYSKQQQEQRGAMAQQAFSKRLQGNGTQASVCRFELSFEVATSGNLSTAELLDGIVGIRAFFIAEGFTVASMSAISLLKQGYYVVFEARNNETEAQVRSLLDNALTAYCESQNIDRSSWLILKLKTTSSCNTEDNSPGPTVWGVNREQALGSLNTALWNYQACSAAQYDAKARFDAIYQSYTINATSSSADIFRTRLSLLIADVPRIVRNYCWNGGVPPVTPINPGGGGGGDTGETIEPVQINIPLKYCNFNFQEAFGVQWQAAGIRGIGIILAPNDGPLIFDIEVGLPMYSLALGRTISRLEAQRESANAYAVAMGIVNGLYTLGKISPTAIPARVALEMEKELNRHFGFTVARVSKTLGVNPGAPTSRANFNLICP